MSADQTAARGGRAVEKDAPGRARAVLRDVSRRGGREGWTHLASQGHSFSTVMKCVRRGWLEYEQGNRFLYEITVDGQQWLGDARPASLEEGNG